jgi:hypothetical protein
MRCEKVRDQFADYVMGAAEESAHSQIAQHLMTCESCRAEAEQLGTLWTALGSLPAGAEPGPGARANFNLMLEAYRHGMQRPATPTWLQEINSWLGRWWPQQPANQFALALALLVLGVALGILFHPGRVLYEVNPEIAELRDELAETRQLVALSLMQQPSASARLKGVNWSYQLPQAGNEVLTALLDTLMHDPNVNVRLATVDALRQFGDQPVVRKGLVEAMARQESPMVQAALVNLVVDLRESESIDTLRQLSTDPNLDVAVRERALKGLEQLQ